MRGRSQSSSLQPEVGSTFAAVDASLVLQSAQTVPWENFGSVQYLETGRQALYAIAKELRSRGVRRVFVPAYLCESMLEPIVASALAVEFLPVTDSLQIDLPAVAGIKNIFSGAPGAVLMVRYFGHIRDASYLASIADLKSRGNIVVEDFTHSLFDTGPSTADYAFASLRKLLPVASGALLAGIEQPIHVMPTRQVVAQELWTQMDSKRDYLAGIHNSRAYFGRQTAATGVLEETLEAHRMDRRSFDLLGHLPYDEFARARRRNFAVLAEQLATVRDISVLNGHNSGVPSHLIVEALDSNGLRARLTEEGIYCPVHWPRPTALPMEIPWKSGHFSIPIDHRYTAKDMMRVGSVIREMLR